MQRVFGVKTGSVVSVRPGLSQTDLEWLPVERTTSERPGVKGVDILPNSSNITTVFRFYYFKK